MIYFCGMEIRSFRTLPSFCLPRSCSSESLEVQVCDSFGLRLGNHTFFGGCGSWFLGPRSWRVANLSMKDPSVLQLFMGNPHTQWRFLDGKIMENHQATSWWIFRCEVGIPVWSKIKIMKIGAEKRCLLETLQSHETDACSVTRCMFPHHVSLYP